MSGAPDYQVDFASLDTLRADPVREITLLRQTSTHLVSRVTTQRRSYILKWFFRPELALELKVYNLLARLGVPTLPVYEQTQQALLLEDLQASPIWRLAAEVDMESPEIGLAVAEWYRRLHAAGRTALENAPSDLAWLPSEAGEVTESALQKCGATFGLTDNAGWKMALATFELLKAKYWTFPQTFNYNDFAAENLALSRDQSPEMRAIVFDYDCFGTGTAYSDWRNVVSSWRGAARTAFQEAYGPVSEAEKIIDEPLALLYGLVVASRREKIPGWARPLLGAFESGEFERGLRRALDE